uniref:Taste receptor type 2 n=1 Tax=Pelusios castaneus TaxID=367368 RepID=A0A8C8SCT1_9SAUR
CLGLTKAIFYLIISAIELSAGVVANGFIVGLNCIGWAKSRALSSYEKIITSLALSRFFLQLLLSSDNFLSKIYAGFYGMIQALVSYVLIWIFINQASLCFASCLSVFYCVKIANQSLFSWLGVNAKLVPWLLLCSMLYCLVTTVSYNFFRYFNWMILSHNSTDTLRNLTKSHIKESLIQYAFLIRSLGSIFPLILFVASSILLIISLWRHIRKMKLNSDFIPSFRNPSTEACMHALESMVSFFILYNIYYVATTCSIGNMSDFSDEWKIMVSTAVSAAYPSVHSIILIIGNPKLKLASILSPSSQGRHWTGSWEESRGKYSYCTPTMNILIMVNVRLNTELC